MSGPPREVTIRPATQADLPALGRLGALLVRTHHEFDPERFIPATPRTEQGYGSFLGSQLKEPDVIVLVAEQDGKVVGYSYAGVEGMDYMSLRGPAGVVHDVVLDPAHRRNGIAKQLLEAILVALKERGAPRVVLSTAERNEPAQRLFDRLGFRRTMVEMTRELGAGVFAGLLLVLAAEAGQAQEPRATLSGRIITVAGAMPIANVAVAIPKLRLSTSTDRDPARGHEPVEGSQHRSRARYGRVACERAGSEIAQWQMPATGPRGLLEWCR